MSAIIEVVSAAIIRRDGDERRMLLGQRSGRSSMPWSWCTIGGKREPGETAFEALRRELREEAKLPDGIELSYAGVAYAYEFDVSGKHYRLFCHVVATAGLVVGGEYVDRLAPVPEHGIVSLGWFDASSLEQVYLAPADAANRGALLQALRAGR